MYCFKLRYKICSPIRLLLPLSIIIFILPFIIQDIQNINNYILIPVLYFISSYCVFINFPFLVENFNSMPLYYEDLLIKSELDDNTQKFHKIYQIVMNLLLSIIFSSVLNLLFIKGFDDKSIAEIFGLIGGVYSLFMKLSDIGGKNLIKVCHYFKTNNEFTNNIINNTTINTNILANNIINNNDIVINNNDIIINDINNNIIHTEINNIVKI